MDVDTNLITVEEAAIIAKVSRTAVYNAVTDGRLPHQRVFGRIIIHRTDIVAWRPEPEQGRRTRCGRPKEFKMSTESKARLAASQKARWAERKATTPV